MFWLSSIDAVVSVLMACMCPLCYAFIVWFNFACHPIFFINRISIYQIIGLEGLYGLLA